VDREPRAEGDVSVEHFQFCLGCSLRSRWRFRKRDPWVWPPGRGHSQSVFKIFCPLLHHLFTLFD